MRSNLVRKLIRIATVPAAVIGITAAGIVPASAAPCQHVADCQLQYNGDDSYTGPQGNVDTDSWWDNFLDAIAVPNFLPNFRIKF